MSTCERCQSEITGTVYVLTRDDASDTASGSRVIMVCGDCAGERGKDFGSFDKR